MIVTGKIWNQPENVQKYYKRLIASVYLIKNYRAT